MLPVVAVVVILVTAVVLWPVSPQRLRHVDEEPTEADVARSLIDGIAVEDQLCQPEGHVVFGGLLVDFLLATLETPRT